MTDAQTDRMGEELRAELEREDDHSTSRGVMYRVRYTHRDGGLRTIPHLFDHSDAQRFCGADLGHGWRIDPVEWEEHRTVPPIGFRIDMTAEALSLLKSADQVREFVVAVLTKESEVGQVRVVLPESPFDWRIHG